MATVATSLAPPARHVQLYKNGDKFYPPKRVIVNFKHTRTMDAFLDNLTTREKPAFGAIRKLYTPVQGHSVKSLDSLEDNKVYVFSGPGRFVDLKYGSLGGNDRRKRLTQQRPIHPVGHSNIRVSAKYIKRQEGPKVVYVFRNGEDLNPAVRVLLHKSQTASMLNILDHITNKVALTNGAVRKLYHMSGKLVADGTELENEHSYVAAGIEKFKKRGYDKQNQLQNSPRNKRVLPPVTRRPPPKAKPSPPRDTNTKKPAQPREPKPPPPKQETTRKPPPPRQAPVQEKPKRRPKPEKTAEQKEAETVFHHKPAMVKRSREKEDKGSLDYNDPNSVFKASDQQKDTEPADEVEENKETAVDLPIDQIAAEEVEEEDFQEQPREATPPPREATPPPREPTPLREPTPQREPTPPREPTPVLDPTPELEPTPEPEREPTPELDPTPVPEEREPTPQREATPPLSATPPAVESQPPNQGQESAPGEASQDPIQDEQPNNKEVEDDDGQSSPLQVSTPLNTPEVPQEITQSPSPISQSQSSSSSPSPRSTTPQQSSQMQTPPSEASPPPSLPAQVASSLDNPPQSTTPVASPPGSPSPSKSPPASPAAPSFPDQSATPSPVQSATQGQRSPTPTPLSPAKTNSASSTPPSSPPVATNSKAAALEETPKDNEKDNEITVDDKKIENGHNEVAEKDTLEDSEQDDGQDKPEDVINPNPNEDVQAEDKDEETGGVKEHQEESATVQEEENQEDIVPEATEQDEAGEAEQSRDKENILEEQLDDLDSQDDKEIEDAVDAIVEEAKKDVETGEDKSPQGNTSPGALEKPNEVDILFIDDEPPPPELMKVDDNLTSPDENDNLEKDQEGDVEPVQSPTLREDPGKDTDSGIKSEEPPIQIGDLERSPPPKFTPTPPKTPRKSHTRSRPTSRQSNFINGSQENDTSVEPATA
ncbi:uncharacterized protein [Asterias amurensis]|uniref:uncharacterized protein n=1 Tax=Asterias amurensis TaxID=7602 RepID=UPI003AB301A2